MTREPLAQLCPRYGGFNELLEQRRFRESRAMLDEIATAYPDHPEVELGYVQQLFHEYDDAFPPAVEAEVRDRVAKAVAADSDNAHVLLTASLAMLNVLDYDEAAAYLLAARPHRDQLEGDPQAMAALYYASARLMHANGKLSVALKRVEMAVQFDGDEPEYMAEMALIHRDAGDIQSARGVLADGLRRHPSADVLRKVEAELAG